VEDKHLKMVHDLIPLFTVLSLLASGISSAHYIMLFVDGSIVSIVMWMWMFVQNHSLYPSYRNFRIRRFKYFMKLTVYNQIVPL
jgi:hypothetical protein